MTASKTKAKPEASKVTFKPTRMNVGDTRRAFLSGIAVIPMIVGTAKAALDDEKIKPQKIDITTFNNDQLIDGMSSVVSQERFARFRRIIHPEMLWDWFVQEISDYLQDFYDDCVAGKRPILVINSPPQHGKSLAVDDFVAWVAGMNPSMRVIFASYSDELGVRANKEVERVMKSVEYRKMFPNTQIDLPGWQMNSGLIEYCGHRGYFRNVTVRGGVTGMALDIGIIDDPIKGRREAHSPTERNAVWGWLTDDFRSRFSKRAGMLMIHTRWHLDDPTGRMLEKVPGTKVLRYPAVAPDNKDGHRKQGEALFPAFKPLGFLMDQKKILTEDSWLALYQQQPILVGGGIIDSRKLMIVKAWGLEIIKTEVKHSVRYWDKAATEGGSGSETAGVLMHAMKDGSFVISSVVHGRWAVSERERIIKQCAVDDFKLFKSYEVVVEREPGSGGKESAEATIRNLAGFRASEDRVTGSKEIRAEGFISQAQIGNVYLVGGIWVKPFKEQCDIWPQGKLRDMIDGASGAFNKLVSATSFNTNYKQWA